jgi:anhydro-N-acetylmuramic acid kinase
LRATGKEYDEDGAWAAGGKVDGTAGKPAGRALFPPAAPKSTGRDLFHAEWLDRQLAAFPNAAPADVQAR